MSSATRITTKGQVVIPKSIREQLRWRPGTRLRVDALASGAVMLSLVHASRSGKAEDDPIERAFGFLTHGDPVGDLEAEHRAEVAADDRRHRHR